MPNDYSAILPPRERSMAKIKYTQRTDGESFTQPTKAIVHWGCCDCGLVHDLVFVAGNKRKIEVACRRNEKETARKRLTKKIKRNIHELTR